MLSSPKIREIPVHHEVIETVVSAVSDLPSKLGRAYGEIENWAARHHVKISAPFARYTLFAPGTCTVEAGYIADRAVSSGDERIHLHENGGYVALTALHSGPFNRIGRAYDALEEFMRIHGYTSAGAPVEYYLTPQDAPPETQRAEIVWPVVPNEL